MKKGIFVTFEGPEGGGKSTHCLLLAEYLKKQGFRVMHTREPGGTKIAESLRRVLLNPRNKITPLTELLLYEASRAQHTLERIIPALKKGAIVLCDRYTDATLAYQGYGRGIDFQTIRNLNSIATHNLVPDLTILLDIPVEQGLTAARTLAKGSFIAGDRLEREDVSFHKRVREGYLALAAEDPRRIKVVPTGALIEETQDRIIKIVNKILKNLRKNRKPR